MNAGALFAPELSLFGGALLFLIFAFGQGPSPKTGFRAALAAAALAIVISSTTAPPPVVARRFALPTRYWLVFGMFLGSGISALVTHRFRQRKNPALPDMWKQQFGEHKAKRLVQAFLGGVLLLFGARLAGGCTSGHMISGISQLTVGSFVFGVSIFASGIIVARMLYNRKVSS